MDKPGKRIATLTNPTVAAALDGLYRYPDEAAAQAQLARIKEHFIHSRTQPGEEAGGLRLWVKGYEVSAGERKEGYRGHFAILRVCKEDKHWTLRAEKDPSPLQQHPQRARPKRSHPDWGHPLLREIKKTLEYPTAAEAGAVLMELHEAFPNASIPGHGKLYLMIYERGRNPAQPVQKYIFKAVPVVEGQEEGAWKIQYIVNPKSKRTPQRRRRTTELPENAQKGFFAQMVERKKRK